MKLKQDLLHELEEATRESNKALNDISHSISTFGKSIGDGLALLASALSNARSNPANSHTSATNSYPQMHQSFSFTPPGYQQHLLDINSNPWISTAKHVLFPRIFIYSTIKDIFQFFIKRNIK